MSDPFASFAASLTGPAERHQLLAAGPAELDPRPRLIYCASAGTIEVEDAAGVALPYTLETGDRIEFRGVRIAAITGGTFYGWT